MIALQERAGGICLPVKVQPGARRNAILGAHAGALKVAVNAAPEQGKANAAVIELLAEQLHLPRASFVQISGATNRQKQFLVSDVTLDELKQRIVHSCSSIQFASDA